MKRAVLQKLLRRNISIPQIAGYAFAALTGMSIIFAAFRFSMDVRPLFSSSANLFKPEYMVVNKKVSVLAVFGAGQTTFKQAEIDEIRRQSFVREVSYFTPSRFRVKAFTQPSSQIPPFSTDLFFESVPDRLLGDANPDRTWNEHTGMIPVIIPRDYLNLYNFGFAGSQGLPQISEGIVQQVVFRVAITGNGQREVFDGRIVGFSDFLNTILVPDAFMVWANKRFGDAGGNDKISRLIVETKNPGDPAIAEFFASKPNYDVSDNKGDQGKLSYFLTLLITGVMVIGGLIMLPAVGLMLLSINLLVYKNQKTLGNLILLGYRRSKLSRPYGILVLLLNVTVGSLSFLVARYIQSLYAPKLATLGVSGISEGFWATAGFAAAFVLLMTLADMLWIRRKIAGIEIPSRG